MTDEEILCHNSKSIWELRKAVFTIPKDEIEMLPQGLDSEAKLSEEVRLYKYSIINRIGIKLRVPTILFAFLLPIGLTLAFGGNVISAVIIGFILSIIAVLFTYGMPGLYGSYLTIGEWESMMVNTEMGEIHLTGLEKFNVEIYEEEMMCQLMVKFPDFEDWYEVFGGMALRLEEKEIYDIMKNELDAIITKLYNPRQLAAEGLETVDDNLS